MILRVAIFLIVVISAQALRRQQSRGDTGTFALGRASSCVIKSRAVRFDDEVISGRQSFGQNGGLYIPPTTDADDDDDDEEEEEPDVQQQDQPEGIEDDEEQEQYDEDDEDGSQPTPQAPPLINLAALFPALAGAAGGGAESLLQPSIPQRPPILPAQYLDPDDIDSSLGPTSGPEQYYGGGPIVHYGGGGGGCRRCYGGKGGKRKYKKKRRGNINCIIITKDKKHRKPHKHKPLSIFGIPITTRRRRSMARRLRALKLQ